MENQLSNRKRGTYMTEHSFNDFNISPEIIRALSKMNYYQPTEVQQKVIPIAIGNQDLIVKAQTGSGKTAAYGIPICHHIEWIENKPQALILTPTRELAAQVKEDLTNIGRFKRIKAAAVYGKQSFAKQQLELKQKNHIVVGTPGRVLDHIQKGTLNVDELRYLVIDEADEMLNMGFIDQVEAIINEIPKERISMLFSATLPDDIQNLSNQYLKEPTFIEINKKEMTTQLIEHSYYRVKHEKKAELLRKVTTIENADSCIVFCRTQEQVNNLFDTLVKWEYSCGKIHGGMYQEDRFDVMNQFKRGEFRYLIATDVAARGIDIENITHVLNYDFPVEKESYVHRTGRTGRAGHTGVAISFVTPFDEELLRETEEYIGFAIQVKEEPTEAEVEKCRPNFESKMFENEIKEDKATELNSGIMKLFFNGGKKKKLRAVDFVGTIAKIEGISAEDIGIITIQDQATFVEILNNKGPIVLQAMKNKTIKGKKLKVYEAFE